MKTLLATPLIHKNKSYGNIYISEKKDGTEFTEIDVSLIKLISVIVISSMETWEIIKDSQAKSLLLQEEAYKIKKFVDLFANRDFYTDLELNLVDENNKFISNNLKTARKAIKDTLNEVRQVMDYLTSSTTEISATTEELANTSKE